MSLRDRASVSAVNQHLKTIFSDDELTEGSVIKKYLITADDGKNYRTNHYSLQAIIAVGFKVNNPRAVQFRKWAGKIGKDYPIQGCFMDKERLIKGHMFTDESLQQIRFRTQVLTEGNRFNATVFNYDNNVKTTRRFFQTVQNKMHYAVH